MSLAKQFMAVFEGSSTAYGQTKIGNQRRDGKTEAKSFIIKEPLREDLVQEHLEGLMGVGAIPINNENMCKFGVIDIDDYPISHSDIIKKSDRFNIPLVVCRSKSGGAHLFLFMKDWVQAVDLREYLTEISAALGYSGSEIFPKQDRILADRGDVGNFINLPYFDVKRTMRYAMNKDGSEMSLQEFLKKVEDKKTTLDELQKIDFGTQKKTFSDAPPCLQGFLNKGVPEGTRNTVLFNVCTYCQKKSPDKWAEMFDELNQKYSTPPLPSTEVVGIQKQHEKKEYQYQCSVEPLKSHCNKSLCKKRKFGVGNSKSLPSLGGLTILLSEPRLYFLDVNGKRLELSTKQLQMPMLFQEACMEQLNHMPMIHKRDDWQDEVNKLMEKATTVDVPEELTFRGQFRELLQIYCTSRIRARAPEELVLGKPWTEGDLTYFTMKGIQEFLRQRGFTQFTRVQIQERLKELGGGNDRYNLKDDDSGSWSQIRVWFVPEFDNEEIELVTEGKEDDDVPF
tara:strand:- start:1712 stop:3238 length:1527 start_codon:yes stop_codon:yes gene_type:complete